jgi:signal transduction histidine kinase/ActR/RegA family two-component response regulator/HPt (histidine-containing phosphotransfer) domain-containing protein
MDIRHLISETKTSPQLRVQLLSLYVANHSANAFVNPAVCVILALIVQQWAPLSYCMAWLAVSTCASCVSAVVYHRFEEAMPIQPDKIRNWLWAIGVPRVIFITAWASLMVWGWDPAQPTTVYFPLFLMATTMAINTSTSGPVLLLYFLELAPKLTVLFIMLLSLGGALNYSLATVLFLGVIIVLRIVFKVNGSARMLLQQKNDIANANEQLEIANRAKSAFLATMSHEIRTPLNGILGIACLLKDSRLSMEQREQVETIRYSGETLLAMLNDVLDFSKLESGKFTTELVAFNLERLTRSVVDLMQSRAAEKGLALTCAIHPGVATHVVSDPLRLRQVLLNLVSNAIKFTEQGFVDLRVSSPAEGRLRFEIKDSGIGISDDAKTLLFTEFSQANSSISRRYGGTGLGLAICSRIVGALGGTIGMDSAPGAGSTFHFEIPAAVADEVFDEAHQDEDERYPLTRPMKILLVDDNHINRKVAQGLLERLDHTVTMAADGFQAVAAVRVDPKAFDLILMDVQMPGCDGIRATRTIQALGEAWRAIPIIALTANAMRGDDERCLAAGMVDHIMKPINPVLLYRALAAHAPPHARLGSREDTESPPPRIVEEAGVFEGAGLIQLEKLLGRPYIETFLSDSLGELTAQRRRMVSASRDAAAMQAVAHDMKSMSAMIGMMDIAALAEGIERACEQQRMDEVGLLMERLGARFQTGVDAVLACYPSVSPA